MRLSELAAGLQHRRAGADTDPEIAGITHDSRKAGPGVLFAAFPGLTADGRTFLPDAVRRGSPAALGPGPEPSGLTVPYLVVPEPRHAAGLLAARLAGEPARALVMAGLTGTSGKTTTALLLDAALGTRHERRGLFGTLVYRFSSRSAELQASRTTPEATELQPMLASLVAEGGTAAVLECSSHAIALERLAGCLFDVAVFTNLSRDHLDFHPDLNSYFETKSRLFSLLKPSGTAVVNADDPWGRKLLDRLSGRKLSFSLEGREADVLGTARLSASGVVLDVTRAATGERLRVDSPLLGRPNAENLLAAAAASLALGLPADGLARQLSSVTRIPGRLEAIPNRLGLTVLVDYAHKPGALAGVLATARSLAGEKGRVGVVFGCGGDRDRGKRPEMGRIAAESADLVVLTSDNSRSEDPEAILAEIRAGVTGAGREALSLVDRRRAIAAALEASGTGDVLVVAGKGHETEQVTGAKREPFDDREVTRELIGALEAARGLRGKV